MQPAYSHNVRPKLLLSIILGLTYLGVTGCDTLGQPLLTQKKQAPSGRNAGIDDTDLLSMEGQQPDGEALPVERLEGAQVLTTQNFVVSVRQNCPEGHVTCDTVTYTGVSKKTGDAITLKGTTLHATCADGITPCRFLGYTFSNGAITYKVLDSGVLRVTQGDGKVLLEEQGTWQY